MTNFDWEAHRKQQSEDWHRNQNAALKAFKKNEEKRVKYFRNLLGQMEPLPEAEPCEDVQVRRVVKEVTKTLSKKQIKWVVSELSED